MKFFNYNQKSLSKRNLITNYAGDFLLIDKTIQKEILFNKYKTNLLNYGFGHREKNDLFYQSYNFKVLKRKHIKSKINYLIIVPTLRCNLSCSYCQVSRASETAKGYDWGEDEIKRYLQFIEKKCDYNLKVEFQGGEPTLRLDLIETIIQGTTNLFPNAEFVICSNIQNISKRLIKILDNEKVCISTSIDGDYNIHKKNRTENTKDTELFFKNFKKLKSIIGIKRISALPTFTSLKDIKETIKF